MASSEEDDIMDNADDLQGDLFGGSDDEAPVEKTRELSDDELDSGDDEDRNDRAADKGDNEDIDYETGREANIQDYTVYRHPLPKPVDGEVRSHFSGFQNRSNIHTAQCFTTSKVLRHRSNFVRSCKVRSPSIRSPHDHQVSELLRLCYRCFNDALPKRPFHRKT